MKTKIIASLVLALSLFTTLASGVKLAPPIFYDSSCIFNIIDAGVGYRYQIQETTDLLEWHTVNGTAPIVVADKQTQIQMGRGTNTHTFYRLLEQPPRLIISTDLSSPAYQIAAAGSIGVIVGVYKLHASGEAMSVPQIALQLTQGNSKDLAELTVWDGATQVGVWTTPNYGNWNSVGLVLSPSVIVPKDGDKTLTLKANLSQIGIAEPVPNSGSLVKVDYLGTFPTMTYGIGMESGQVFLSSGETHVDGVRIFKSYPTFMKDYSFNHSLVNGFQNLFSMSVGASPRGDIELSRLSFMVQTFNCTVSDLSFSDAFGGQNGVIINTNNWPIVTVTYPNREIIAAGASMSFLLRGTVIINGVGPGQWVAVTLLGDTGYLDNGTMGTLNQVESGAHHNVIWSPISEAFPADTDPDWTNGYQLPGLPTGGFTEFLTN